MTENYDKLKELTYFKLLCQKQAVDCSIKLVTGALEAFICKNRDRFVRN